MSATIFLRHIIYIVFLSGTLLLLNACNQGKQISGEKPLASQESFILRYGHLHNSLFRIKTEKQATVAFLGGSITNMDGWRKMVSDYLQETFPNTKFTFINAGIPSLGSVPHAFRLQKDVLDKGRIDLLFIESAVNDHQNNTPERQQRRALEGIVRHAITANPFMDMVLMAFAEKDKLDEYASGSTPTEVNVHNDIANHYHLPFINLAKEVYARIAAGEFSWEKDFKDLHPSPFGQQVYFESIKSLLQPETANKPSADLLMKKIPEPLDKFSYNNGRYIPVEQADSMQGFQTDIAWKPADGTATRSGYVNVPVLTAEKTPASLRFHFTGTAAGIAVLAGPDAGKIRYAIDNGPDQYANLFTRWSSRLHLPWYLVLGDGLEPGKHTLQITLLPPVDTTSKNTACRIVHFLVN